MMLKCKGTQFLIYKEGIKSILLFLGGSKIFFFPVFHKCPFYRKPFLRRIITEFIVSTGIIMTVIRFYLAYRMKNEILADLFFAGMVVISIEFRRVISRIEEKYYEVLIPLTKNPHYPELKDLIQAFNGLTKSSLEEVLNPSAEERIKAIRG
ncbi:MAG: hypothetical protein PHH69_04470 [Candidatus Omnitrophica bacterium]|nr:hypothetical protein [Candidatus Omnitrophota bacterium]